MSAKRFTQEEVNRIVAMRVKREQERLSKDFENRLKRCMASVHLTLHQEMCAMKRDMAAEAPEALLPPTGQTERPDKSRQSVKNEIKTKTEGGEKQ